MEGQKQHQGQEQQLQPLPSPPLPYPTLPHPLPTSSLLPTTYYLLPTTYCLLPTTYYLLPTTYYLLPTTYYLPPTTYHRLPPSTYLLPTTDDYATSTDYILPTTFYTYYRLPTTDCLLPTTYYLLPTTCYPLPPTYTTYYLLPTVLPATYYCIYYLLPATCYSTYTTCYLLLYILPTLPPGYISTYYTNYLRPPLPTSPPAATVAPLIALGRVPPKGLISEIGIEIDKLLQPPLGSISEGRPAEAVASVASFESRVLNLVWERDRVLGLAMSPFHSPGIEPQVPTVFRVSDCNFAILCRHTFVSCIMSRSFNRPYMQKTARLVCVCVRGGGGGAAPNISPSLNAYLHGSVLKLP